MSFTKEQTKRIKEELEEITERELEEKYTDMLNEVYGTVSICGYDYDAADALRSTDPVAFRCGYSDWLGTTEEFTEVDGECYHTSEVEDLIEKLDEIDEILELERLEEEEESC